MAVPDNWFMVQVFVVGRADCILYAKSQKDIYSHSLDCIACKVYQSRDGEIIRLRGWILVFIFY